MGKGVFEKSASTTTKEEKLGAWIYRETSPLVQEMSEAVY